MEVVRHEVMYVCQTCNVSLGSVYNVRRRGGQRFIQIFQKRFRSPGDHTSIHGPVIFSETISCPRYSKNNI